MTGEGCGGKKVNSERKMQNMLQRIYISLIATAAILILGAAQVRGDEAEATVLASGHATAPQKAEILRMTLLLSAQGTDVHDALAKLKTQRDDAKSKLAATGADEASIKFSDPVEGNGQTLTLQQRMMQQVMAARGQQPASTQPSGVTISSTLTVEWPLPAAAGDDALAAALDLEGKIKAAIPKGGAESAKTPEEQEIAEEMAAQQGAAEGPKADEPQFVFVHKLTDDDRTKLLADAFADAQAQGRQLAAAAGKELGDVTNISMSAGDSTNPQTAYIEAIAGESDTSSSASNDSEVSAAQVNNVSFSVMLSVTFKLK